MMQKAQKRLLRNAVLMAVFTFGMAILLVLYVRGTGPMPGASQEPVGYADGVYTATEQGYLSEVTVTVTISGGAIASVEADASGETPALGGAAAEQLSSAIAAAGGTGGVDAVSGSTYTSEAVLAAVDNCLAQAKG